MFKTIARCIPRSVAALALLVPMLWAVPAMAAVSITIDGDLADLEAAIAANQLPNPLGQICNDVVGEIGSGQCTYYVNGFDLQQFDVLVVPNENPGGGFTGDATLYAGWVQVGLVGDVDGDGNPDAFTPLFSCASTDQVGIGSYESYTVDLDLDCDGAPNVRYGVKGNQVVNFDGLVVVPGASFARVGHKLEVKIPNIIANSGIDAGICDMVITGGSNAEFDQLAEDDCKPGFKLSLEPLIKVTKTPETQNACPGSQVSWLITIENVGPCTMETVAVTDVLDLGMTYVSDDRSSTGDAQNRAWQFGALAPGEQIVINLTARLADECVNPTLDNTVRVEGTSTSPCRPEPASAIDEDVASVNCTKPECAITGPDAICLGGSAQFCGPDVAGLSYKWSTGATTRCITVNTAGTYTLEVTDQNGCKSTCEKTLTAYEKPACSISGPSEPICEDQSAELCGLDVAGYTYLWSTGATTRCITVSVAGTYSLEVTDANNCKNTCEFVLQTKPCVETCCWLTMGGFLNASTKSGNKESTYGGNVGPPPSGSWQHIERIGKEEVFNFHSWDARVLACGNDGNAGPCHPAGDANWINYGGTGKYSLNGGAREGNATFTARAEDHGEPGNQPDRNGGCGTPDFYRIEVRDSDTDEIVFATEGYVDGGNVQIHDCKHAKQAESSRGGRGGPLKSAGAGDTSAETASLGTTLELYRPTPNPFTATTTIAYAVNASEGADVQIGIYNVAGRQIRSLVSGFQAAGRYQVSWDGRGDDGVAATHGVYFLRAFVGGQRVDAVSRILYLR